MTALFSLHSAGICYIIVRTIKFGVTKVLKDLSQIIEKVVDFCQERTDVLMIGGVALLILIVLISIVRSIVKSGDDKELDFDESIYFRELSEAKAKKAIQDEVSDSKEKEYGSEPKEIPPAEKCKQNVIFPEALLEELSKVSSNNLQEVEIKIQSAELKIKYSGAKLDGGQALEEIKIFQEKPDTGTETSADSIDEESAEKKPIDEKESQPELAPEEIEGMKVEAPVKFGAGNYNISKSGKVFTEEELEKQIRD